VTDIRSAIDKELERKVAIEAARMAAAKSHWEIDLLKS
jgi:hypothetical protein